jgi:hypothetical protein
LPPTSTAPPFSTPLPCRLHRCARWTSRMFVWSCWQEMCCVSECCHRLTMSWRWAPRFIRDFFHRHFSLKYSPWPRNQGLVEHTIIDRCWLIHHLHQPLLFLVFSDLRIVCADGRQRDCVAVQQLYQRRSVAPGSESQRPTRVHQRRATGESRSSLGDPALAVKCSLRAPLREHVSVEE